MGHGAISYHLISGGGYRLTVMEHQKGVSMIETLLLRLSLAAVRITCERLLEEKHDKPAEIELAVAIESILNENEHLPERL